MDQLTAHQLTAHDFVELIGIEPTTSSLRTKRSPKLSYSPEERLIVNEE